MRSTFGTVSGGNAPGHRRRGRCRRRLNGAPGASSRAPRTPPSRRELS